MNAAHAGHGLLSRHRRRVGKQVLNLTSESCNPCFESVSWILLRSNSRRRTLWIPASATVAWYEAAGEMGSEREGERMRWWEMVSKPEHGRAGAISILLREPGLPFLDGRVGVGAA